ncbi:MAG: cation transporter [Gemmatimonadales bacterium]|nr:cation transporter [Gemmatimonadales bacterium]
MPTRPVDQRNCVHLAGARALSAGTVRRLWAVLGMTGLFMIVEAIGGWLSGSLALLADAGHMLTDVGALGLSLLTAWIAQRPADESKTYGYQRWEILAALVNGAALFGIAGWVTIEAIRRIQSPEPVRADLFLGIAAAGLVVNLISLRILHGAHTSTLNARGAYLHVLGDLLGSVGALGAAAIIALTGWTLADPLISVLLAVLILTGAWRLMRESTDILLDAVPGHVAMPDVQRRMLSVSGVSAVHDLHVWTVGNGIVAMSGHAVVPSLDDHPEVLGGIRSEMAGLGISHVTIQLEVEDECVEAGAAVHQSHDHGLPGHRH